MCNHAILWLYSHRWLPYMSWSVDIMLLVQLYANGWSLLQRSLLLIYGAQARTSGLITVSPICRVLCAVQQMLITLIMVKWLVPSTYQTQCTKAVSHTALNQINTLHKTLLLSEWVQTQAQSKPTWVWPIHFSDWSLKHNPDVTQHNMEKWLEQNEYTFSRRNTLSHGGLRASFNMTNHISSPHSP